MLQKQTLKLQKKRVIILTAFYLDHNFNLKEAAVERNDDSDSSDNEKNSKQENNNTNIPLTRQNTKNSPVKKFSIKNTEDTVSDKVSKRQSRSKSTGKKGK